MGGGRTDTRTADEHLTKPPYWSRHIERWQWRHRIIKLDDPLRGAVAAIVWWDVFSVRLWPDRWDDLDDLIGNAESVSDEELIAGLVSIGYETHRATGRVVHRTKRRGGGRPRLRSLEQYCQKN
jgi:hypothetical protein